MPSSASTGSWTGSLSWVVVASAAAATFTASSVALALSFWPAKEPAEQHGGGASHAQETTFLTFAGLENRKNTCFFNALLQALASSSQVRSELNSTLQLWRRSAGGAGLSPRITLALEQLLSELAQERTSSVVFSASALLGELFHKYGDFFAEAGDQQDSLEALARLKEAVQEELDSLPTTSDDGLLLLLRPEPALPKDRLQLSEDELRRLEHRGALQCLDGTLITYTTCSRCGHQFISEAQPCHHLSVPLRPGARGRSLSALLAALFAPETIEGVSCPACAHAAASSALTRSLMALTLKRAALHRSASKQLEGQEDHSSPGNKTESMDMDPQDSSHQALELVDSMSSTLRDILDRISKCKYPGECSCSSLMEKSLGACLDQIPSSECHPLASLGQELAKAQAWPSSRQQAERRTVIGILPQVVYVHLQRLVMTPYGTIAKLREHVQFPSSIDLTPYTLIALRQERISTKCVAAEHQGQHAAGCAVPGAEPDVGRSSDDLRSAEAPPRVLLATSEQRERTLEGIDGQGDSSNGPNLRGDGDGRSPWAPSLSNNTAGRKECRSVHNLVAVLAHVGNAASGHYITYRRLRHSSGGRGGKDLDMWFCASDESVGPVGLDEVLDACPSVLIYEVSATSSNGSVPS